MKRRLFALLLIIFAGYYHSVGQCSAQFLSDSTLCFGDSISFQFNGTAMQVSWDFGDAGSGVNNTDTARQTFHYFSAPGIFSVQLIASDSACSDTFVREIRVFGKLIADFSFSDNCLNLPTVFNASAKLDSLDVVSKYFWHLGSSSTDSNANVSISFADTGLQTVVLRVQSEGGCVDSISKIIRVYPALKIQTNKNTSCAGQNIQFNLIDGSLNGQQYAWQFGDGSSSSLQNPVYQYQTNGFFAYKLSVLQTDSSSCLINGDTLEMYKLPNPEITLLSDSIQCFKGNEFCFKFVGTENNIVSRSVLMGDGNQFDFGPNDSSFCYKYSDTAGSIYDIGIEVIDSNGCLSSIEKEAFIKVHQWFNLSFTATNLNGCFQTTPVFTNRSNQAPPRVVSFVYDFDDGTFDSTNWNTTHTYNENGTFNVNLSGKNDEGCVDTFRFNGSIRNINFEVDAKVDSTTGSCKSTNFFRFNQTPVEGGAVTWYLGESDTFYTWTVGKSYMQTGLFFPRIRVRVSNCQKLVSLDTVTITGPTAIIGSITNGFQCSARDTVYFSSASTFEGNQSAFITWDLGNGPSCTTNTLLGINVGLNCRYSTDSLTAKHFYTSDGCYMGNLIVADTIVGCADTARFALPLMAPKAGPDTSFFPARGGLVLLRNTICLGPEEEKAFIVDLSQTTPSCGRQSYWVMWDSARAAASGNFNSFWEAAPDSHNYVYNEPPFDSSGFVTIGLVINNGRDTSGNLCTDTAWYRHFLQFEKHNPTMLSDYRSDIHYCKGSTLRFWLKDTLQQGVIRQEINFGDGSPMLQRTSNFTQTFTHTFNRSGNFVVSMRLYTAGGCLAEDTIRIPIGTAGSFSISPVVEGEHKVCLGDSFRFFANAVYYGFPSGSGANWNNPARDAAGKEGFLWNFGDDNQFYSVGQRPYKTYDSAGIYSVTLVYRDSVGCTDTFRRNNALVVQYFKSEISVEQDTFVCAQPIRFTSHIALYDSVSSYVQDTGRVFSYSWNFGPGLAPLVVANPVRFLSAGDYNVKLNVQNEIGCVDSSFVQFTIIGPKPFFEFVGDSVSCQPARIKLTNLSKNASNYIWRFNNPTQNVLNTSSDSNVFFSYSDFGLFYPTLTAQGTFTRNGIPVTCAATFPDSLNPGPREVFSKQIPTVNFSHQTNCFTKSTNFTNLSTLTTSSISAYLWDFGDGNTSTNQNPMHQFNDTGRYVIRLTVYGANGCEASLARTIVISPTPVPNFTSGVACPGNPMQFTDQTQSFNDVIVRYSWDFGDNTFSNIKNPSKIYDSAGLYKVLLSVTNLAGCVDSISKFVPVYTIPDLGFSYDAQCATLDMLLQNTTTGLDSMSFKWTFGDGTFSTAENPLKSFANPGTYAVKLWALSDKGCEDSIVQFVPVYPRPVADFLPSDSQFCLNNQDLFFTNNSSIDTGSFTNFWHFGDAQNSTQSNPLHRYADTGLFQVSLMLQSNQNCKDTAVKWVRIVPNTITDFVVSSSEAQCVRGNEFSFIDMTNANGSAYQRSWKYEQVDGVADSIVRYGFLDTGFFEVRLITTTTKGCKDTAFQFVRTYPQPKANFEFITDSLQCLLGNIFEMNASSSIPWGGISHSWRFGNGQSSTQQSPSVNYSSAGVYSVQLIANSGLGCSDTTYKLLEVHRMPIAAFQISDSLQCLRNNMFEFVNQSGVDSGTLSYSWAMGDASSRVSANVQHSYINFGVFNPQLIVNTERNCSDTFGSSLEVYPMPQSFIKIQNDAQCVNNQLFIFQDSSQIAYGTLATSWDFGNGIGSSFVIDSTQYDTAGFYTIRLAVSSLEGCADTSFANIEVYPKPSPNFSINETTQCQFDNIFEFADLTNVSKGTVVKWEWDFGDGNQGLGAALSHRYVQHDTFKVSLFVETNFGCQDTVSKHVVVLPKPQAFIQVNDTNQCVNPNLFVFSSQSNPVQGEIVNYEWTIASEAVNSFQLIDTFSYFFATHGVYAVDLFVENSLGCKDSVQLAVEVYPKPNALFEVNDSGQCINNQQFVFNNLSSIPYGGLNFDWFMGDSAAYFNLETPLHSYANHDTFDVVLIATSLEGCKDTALKQLVVYPKPFPDFEANQYAQCVNINNFEFENNAQIDFGTMAYEWEVGNGLDSFDSKEISYRFLVSGAYNILLRAISDNGCVDTISKFVVVHPKPLAQITIPTDTSQCLYTNSFLYVNSSQDTLGVAAKNWILHSGEQLKNVDSVFVKYNEIGFKTVELQVLSDLGCSDTTQRPVFVKPMPDPGFEKLKDYYCNNEEPIDFAVNTPGGTFYGKNIVNNQYLPQRLWRDTVEYKVVVEGCLDSSRQFTQVFPAPEVDLGPDTFLCKLEVIDVDVTFWNSNYLWHDLGRNPVRMFNSPGTYHVKVSNLCGEAFDTFTLTYGQFNCRMFLPTAFSPNNDGLNDVYKPLAYDVDEYVMRIYTRWGEMIYEGTQTDPGWDGTYRGTICPQGVFVAQVSYSYQFKGKPRNLTERTTFHLVR